MKKTIIVSILALLLSLGLFPSLSIGDEQMRRKPKDNIMTPEKIAEYRQKLRTILNNKNDGQRFEELEQLAKEVGAGYVNTKIAGTSPLPGGKGTAIHQNPISESELVLNINNALQTETMIDMCNTAAKNFWITLIATIVAFFSVLVAGFSALAAWVAIVKKVK